MIISSNKRKLISLLGTGPLWIKPVVEAVVLPVHAQTSADNSRISNVFIKNEDRVVDFSKGESISVLVDLYIGTDVEMYEGEIAASLTITISGGGITYISPIMVPDYYDAYVTGERTLKSRGRHVIEVSLNTSTTASCGPAPSEGVVQLSLIEVFLSTRGPGPNSTILRLPVSIDVIAPCRHYSSAS